ncbi:MAG: glycosyltransferase [Syntrophomonadaceae bacterium]|nr:glycosyltransferase [Syntrophomonadaceae bacterium]
MKVANLGTYLPKQCGIATFSNDLRCSLLVNNVDVDIIAISDHSYQYDYADEVIFNIRQNQAEDYVQAADTINKMEDIKALIIQHEYGIFGGNSGNYVLDFVNKLNKPFIVITHTVLAHPLPEQKAVLNQLCSKAAKVVAMTLNAKELLADVYAVKADIIKIIGHGVPYFAPLSSLELKAKYGFTDNEIISTFGLIGPGKGLELGIRAMAELVKFYPNAKFLILGQTHPMLKKAEGEKYREMLVRLSAELGLERNVIFVNKFLSDEELGEYLYLTDVYLSPYPNLDQAVSGTLTFAIGCGRAIVSTAYLYAKEVLQDERGLLAHEAKPELLAQLINSILADDELKNRLEANALSLGETWSWPNIGSKYANLLTNIC